MRHWFVGLAALLLSPFAFATLAAAQDKPGGQMQPFCVEGCGGGGVTVEPEGDGTFQVPANSGPHQLTFLVHNTGSSTRTFTLSCSSAVLSCGTVSPAALTLPGGSWGDADVSFTAGTQAGELTLTASGPATGSGSYWVSITTEGAPSIALPLQNGSNLDRGLCLTTGAGEAAALSCGDLVVTHGMPAYRTLGKDRALTLLYNSATAAGLVLVPATITQAAGTSTPSALRLVLTVGALRDSAQYSPLAAGQSQQMVIGRGITGLATGVYPFTLTARNMYPGGNYDAVITGTVLVVNRSASEYGAGWALVGLEQVLTDPGDSTRRVWVAGDGSIRLYTKPTPGSNIFLGAAGDAPDSLVRFDTLCTPGCQQWYRRDLKHGAAVTFDATGRHAVTRNRVGARTTFTWGTVAGQPRLLTITVPPNDATSRSYTFSWNGTTARLDSIRDPGGRRLGSTMTAGTLTALTDPDNQVTRFTYTGNRLTRRIYPRQGMQGDSAYTSFAYANSARVTAVSIQTDSAGVLFATTALTPWDERGLAQPFGTLSTGAATTAAGLPTRVDGPMAGLGDASELLVNRFGQPTQVTRLGLNTVTTIAYDSVVRLPARPTRVTYPHATIPGATGRIVRLSWNPRGNLAEVRDSTCHKLAGCAPAQVNTTTYQYTASTAPDSPTLVTDALGRFTTYTYTALGLTDSIIDPRSHRTKFWYRSAGALLGIVDSTAERMVETWNRTLTDTGYVSIDQVTRFTYDANGGVTQLKGPTGVRTSYVADALGRTTAVYDPLGSRTTYAFDPMNRITAVTRDSAKQTHPGGLNPLATGAGGCDTLQILCVDLNQAPNVGPTLVASYFHGPAGLDSVADPRGVKRRFVRDARGSVIRELDEFLQARTTVYDQAGLLVRTLGRTNVDHPHRDSVTYQYDGQGRRAAMWLSRTPASPPYAGDIVAGDTTTYGYDLLGRVVTAANRHGTILRSYYDDGTLRTQVTVFPSGRDSAAYEYDASGARTRVSRHWSPTGATDLFSYSYNGAGDLASIVATWAGGTPAPSTVTFTWDGLGRRHRLGYPNGVTVNLRYDAAGTLRRQVVYDPPHGLPAGTDNLMVTYKADSVDALGRALRLTWICGGRGAGSPCGGTQTARVQRSRYDRFGWTALTTNPAGTQEITYKYDKSGNLTAHLEGAPTAYTNHFYRYATTPALSNVMILDSAKGQTNGTKTWLASNANGARIGEFHGSTQDKLFYYDALGRIAGIRDYDLYSSGYIDCNWYNPDGQLFRVCDIESSRQIFDGHNVAALDAERWVFLPGPGLDDPLLGVRRATPGTARLYFYVTDGQGRQLTVAHESGSLIDDDEFQYQYKGGKFAGGSANAQSYASSRMEVPTNSPGISYFRNRAYDQATGRWLQEDPIGIAGGLNLYQFNGNDPGTYTDPFGLTPCSDLRDRMDRVSEDLDGRMSRYLAHHASGEGDTGHRIAIEQDRNRLLKLQRKYDKNCKGTDDDDPRWPGAGTAVELVKRVEGLPSPQQQRSWGYRPTKTPPYHQQMVGALAATAALLFRILVVLSPFGL